MDINLELYKVFCETAKSCNISKAAEKLFVSQSAVSQSIKQLEKKLGVKLFDRNARGVRLTTEGKVLFSYVNSAISLIENAQLKLSNMQSLNAGEIKIGASDTICSLFLLPILRKFNTKYPDIHISVTNRTTRESIGLLKSGSVDLSFVNLPIEEDPLLEITPVMPIRDCFVTGDKYAYLAGSVMDLSELLKYPILMLEKSSNSRKQMDIFMAGNNLEIQPAIELGSLTLLAEFAKIGLGIAATIKEDVQNMLDRHELYELSFNETLPTRYIGLLKVKDVTLSSAAKAFVNTLPKTYLRNTTELSASTEAEARIDPNH